MGELSEEEKERLKDKSNELQEKMKEAVRKIRDAEADFKGKRRKLSQEEIKEYEGLVKTVKF